MDIAGELRKNAQFTSFAVLVAALLLIPALSIANEPKEGWKPEAEKWKAEAERWEAIATSYEEKYGWINDQYIFCSLNRDLSKLFGYDGPECIKPFEPICIALENCIEWEIENYRFEIELWIECRNEYIREAQDDAGCALMKIREGIDAAVKGR